MENSSDAKKFIDVIKEWKEVVVLVVGACVSVLTTIGIQPQGRGLWIGLAITAVLLAVAGYWFYRTKRKSDFQRRRDEAREAFRSKRQHRTAFRGLYPFQEGDTLPGIHRQREAQTIFTQITDRDFSFGVVCGDSGCGKTSLLRSALQTQLREDGEKRNYRTLYLSSPRELASSPSSRSETDGTPAVTLQRELQRLDRLVTETANDLPIVLIIDQFEELFIEYRGDLRKEIGASLNNLIKRRSGSRVLCAIRRDYLVDLRDLAPQLPEPISVRNLFVVKNLSVEQAANIIKECAEADEIELEEGLADTLAEELSDGGEVRPPELQIVCTALVGNPTIAEYRLAGGARGILSHYIQNAIELCGDSRVGGPVLRALSDFPAHAKRNPQTLEALGGVVTAPAGIDREQLLDLIQSILTQFEADRLVLVDERGNEPTYSLIHDYLVDAVATATSDMSTRREEANQLLQYYVSQVRSNEKIKMPFRRARFIKKFADPVALKEKRAVRVMRSSRNAYLRSAFAISALVLVLTAILVGVLSTGQDWDAKEIGRHFPHGESGSTSLNIFKEGNQLITGLTAARTIRLWETKTGKLLYEHKGNTIVSPSADFMLFQSEDRKYLKAVLLPSGEVYETPIPGHVDVFGDFQGIFLGRTESNVAYFDALTRDRENSARFETAGVLRIWSLSQKSELYKIEGVRLDATKKIEVSSGVDRFVVHVRIGKDSVPTLWDLTTNKILTNLTAHGDTGLYVVDDAYRRIASTHVLSDGTQMVRLWDVATGTHPKSDLIVPDSSAYGSRVSPQFSSDGEYLLLSDRFVGNEIRHVVGTSDLLVSRDGPQVTSLLLDSKEKYLVWPSQEGMYLWRVAKDSKPTLLRELRLDIAQPQLLGVSQARNMLALMTGNRLQLFDVNTGTKLQDVQAAATIKNFKFTLDGDAIALRLEGGVVGIYSLIDGALIAEFRDMGGYEAEIYYDSTCQRAHVWTVEGLVLRYSRGRRIFGRWFWPEVQCAY